uniref:Serine/threonine-protein phosphatase n=1 Tax=Parascaris univalens TaxID=6257 RepID=A0A915APA8_PARUN
VGDSMVGRRRRVKPKEELRLTVECCVPVTQSIIDELIGAILRSYEKGNFGHIITLERFIFICHKVIDVLADGETLEYIHDANGMAIIGDIHGNFVDLLNVLFTAGWPEERTVIFLGDYVDRGPNSVEVVLLLLLLKIRYPKRIFLLRGNHETIEVNREYGLPATLANIYGVNGNFLYYTLNSVFDWLPIAAIISDQVYCCHGGISQYEYDRSNLRRLARPTSWLHPKTDLPDALLLTDTLWADPAEYEQRKPFVPSERGASYIFNREALIDQLRRLKCRVLIRAHCPFEKGFTKSLDGFCYTVHSSKDPRRECYEAAMLLLDFNTETSLIEAQVVYHRADECDFHNLVEKLLDRSDATRNCLPMSEPLTVECSQCALWRCGFSKEKILWDRCLAHEHLYDIIKEFSESNSVGQYYMRQVRRYNDVGFGAAVEFPNFLHEMNEDGGIMTIKKTRNELEQLEMENGKAQLYDFEIYIPNDEKNWPKLVVKE